MGGGVSFRDPEARDPEASKEADVREMGNEAVMREASISAPTTIRISSPTTTSAASRSPVTWRCHVSHPSAAPYPARPSAPVDSSTPAAEAAVEAATAAARRGGSIRVD